MAACRRVAFALMFALALSARSGAEEKPKSPKVAKGKHDYAGTTVLMGELRALFATWDLNNDGYLDKEELAKAFRGTNAKPYQLKTDGSRTPSGKYPDYDFLIRLDQDGDGRISRPEFVDWARGYALELKRAKSTQYRVAQLERSLARKLSEEERQKVTAELRDKRQTLTELHKQMQGLETIEKHLQRGKP